uniref:EF-hand domain-containing protein n=1 Tax=Ascaris lumbricoides TaxID=6252 RepID=A0A0M3IDY0_ASCLU
MSQAHLHRDILKIECERRDVESPPKGVISEISFADLLLMYSCLGEQKQRKLLKRVKKRYGPNSPERTVGLFSSIFTLHFEDLYEIENCVKFLSLMSQAHLHRDILKIECERRDVESPPKGVISEISFADLLLMYSCLGEQKQRKLLKRVKKRYGPNSPERTGITLKEVFAFFCFLYYIDDVDLALHFYHLAGVSIDGDALKMVAKRVTGSEISDHVVDVVITLFDDNKDGQLSNKEFVSIMKKRMKRGLERPRDTGLLRLFEALGKCTVSQAHYAMYAALHSH